MTKLPLPRPTPMFAGVARDFDEMQNRLRRFFTDGFPVETLPLTEPLGWLPVVEIVEKDNELVLTAELPGMAKEDVEVVFEDDVLTIRGEKKDEKREKAEKEGMRYHLWERSYGAFQRAFTLPRTIDAAHIVADFKDGILTVHMPKTALAQAKGRKIEIAAKN